MNTSAVIGGLLFLQFFNPQDTIIAVKVHGCFPLQINPKKTLSHLRWFMILQFGVTTYQGKLNYLSFRFSKKRANDALRAIGIPAEPRITNLS